MPISNSNLFISAMQFRAEMTFKKVRDLLEMEKIPVILLKGPHLGATVYDSPKERLYADLDILVKPRDFHTAAEILRTNNFQPFAFDQYDLEVQRDFKHWEYRSPSGVIVELHRWLSGHDRYPLDVSALFERAEPFLFWKTPARGLGREDLLLHLCLHMGTSYFHVIERKHVLDIALHINKNPIAWPVFLQRVTKAGAKAVAYYSLQAARRLDGAEVPQEVMQQLRPGYFRRFWLERHIDAGNFPMFRFPEWPIDKAKKNLLLPLMDRPGQWGNFLQRMVVVKFRIVWRKIKKAGSRWIV